jgi:ferritin-like metal-binding protein YciE
MTGEFEGEVLDAGLIGAAQRVEHYEIAAYGTIAAFAELLGESEQQSLLNETLQEEKETAEKLTELSKEINVEANEDAVSGEDMEEVDESPSRQKIAKRKPGRAA